MLRTQIQLTEKQAARLKAIAARRGVSVAMLIRQGVDIVISQGGASSVDELYRRAALPVGRFHSGRNDISIQHDAYLAEEFPE